MFEYNKDQKYTEKWFDRMIPIWEKIFMQHIAPIGIKNVLEIGCYEGRATSFVCEKYLQKGTNYDIVDTFATWLPFVELREIDINTGNQDKNQINIKIVFNIKRAPNTIESVGVVLE